MKMTATCLWGKVRRCFESDDGSLPAIQIERLSAAEVAELYLELRRRGSLADPASGFWDKSLASLRPLDDVPNAAELVARYEAEPFHCALVVRWDGTQMPPLGVHVFQETIAIDHRMGVGWSADAVLAYFGLLADLVSRTMNGVIVPATVGPLPEPESFMEAWHEYVKAATSTARGGRGGGGGGWG